MLRAAIIANTAWAALVLTGCTATMASTDDGEATDVEAVRLTFVDRQDAIDQVVSAETAFAERAQRDGQWTAFRATAAPGAWMFVPQPVRAEQWLAGRADPSQSVRWQPREVWLSCDATLAVSTGAWQRPDGTHGYFTTIWQRQAMGDWRWVLDHGDSEIAPQAPISSVRSHVPNCPMRWAGTPVAQAADPLGLSGASRDGSMEWTARVGEDGARQITVRLISPDGMVPIIDNSVPAATP